MRIGLFGGSFNPPHLGHLHLADVLYHKLNLDEVRLIPAKIPPHKSADHYAPADDRLAMCQLMAENYTWLSVDDFELRQQQISYTYYTAMHFRDSYPDAELFLLVGSDMLTSFTQWFRWQEILSIVSLACIAREQQEFQSLIPYAENLRQSGKIFLVNADCFTISSTKIRDLLRKNQNCSCYLSQKIVKYIREKNLYSGCDADVSGKR